MRSAWQFRRIASLATGLAIAVFALAATASCEEIRAESRLTAVTVFPNGAEVTRTLTVDLAPGEHTIVLDGLPGDLARQSIRVKGTSTGSVAVGSVDVRMLAAADAAADPARRDLERQIERLTDERITLDRTIADAGFTRDLLATLAQRTLQPAGKDTSPEVPPPAELSALLDLVNGRLAQVSRTILDAQVRQRQIDRDIEALNRKLQELAPPDRALSEVAVHITAAKASQATLDVTYRLAAASWQPVYEARLETGEAGAPARLSLVRYASVAQATTEQWDAVALTLSTARPTGATSAPDLGPLEIHSYVAGYHGNRAAPQTQAPPEMVGEAPVPPTTPSSGNAIEQMQATATVAGFQALYAIPGRVTIDNTGTSKNVRIAAEDMSAKLSLEAVPKLDLTAFLVARFAIGGDTPLLPGPVMLFRDGVFIGEGSLPLLAPGEPHDLGFGADDLVKIERREISHRTGETGLISSASIDERSYVTTIASRHAMAMPITILDQVPYAVDERIRVELLADTTPPTEKDIEKKRGVYSWTLKLEPRSRTEIRFGFRVTWPRDLQLMPMD